MFFEFRQNNSGGRFTFDAARGISVSVWVEADSKDEAVLKAEELGIYFDGVSEGRDCDCCGDRWYRPWDEGQEDPPSSVGIFMRGWAQIEGSDAAEGYLHLKDGSLFPLDTHRIM